LFDDKHLASNAHFTSQPSKLDRALIEFRLIR
jgi:hypothetical protein